MGKPAGVAQGVRDGDGVLVADVGQANRLHNKSLAGSPQPGNALRLSLVEAAHCVESEWLEATAQGKPLASMDLLAAASDPRRALDDYLVYRDLRGRGLVARHAPGTSHFDVWPRGVPKGPAAFQVVACADTDPVLADDLLQGAAGGLVAAVVDEDGAVTHYRLADARPGGAVDAASLPKAKGARLADRVLVGDAVAVQAYRTAFLGTPHGDAQLLGATEAAYLRSRRLLKGDGAAAAAEPAVLATYAALRDAGVVPRSGFRFGTHLRAYRDDPDAGHADWLIHCPAAGEPMPWSLLSRGVRLAHGVKKQFLVALPGSPVRFVHLAWTRL